MDNEILEISESELNEILDLLKNYQEDTRENLLYVFFEPVTGSIKSISSNIDECNLPYITVNHEDDKKKLSKQDVFFKYKISYDPEQQKNILIEVDLDIEQITKVNDIIFQFPHSDRFSDEDIVIIQNTNINEWIFSINQNLSKTLASNPLAFDYYYLYITDYNDPNILHRTIILPMLELVQKDKISIKFESDIEKENLSIFARKHFKTHVHIKR
jgi:hypothetical protein